MTKFNLNEIVLVHSKRLELHTEAKVMQIYHDGDLRVMYQGPEGLTDTIVHSDECTLTGGQAIQNLKEAVLTPLVRGLVWLGRKVENFAIGKKYRNKK